MNIQHLMQQAQQMQAQMQKQMQQVQEELGRMDVVGEAGNGLVKVTMSGRNVVKRVAIDPSLLGDDPEMLEDLVAAAVNDAVRRAEALSKEKMGAVTQGLNLPPGMNLPF